ncbi:hypothetical protein BC829DRAFT_401894 [Chytridium lagenaria]|nr:hypothetical protein BC829DRAFT_401894 [Chytridium lagenaria]
MSKRQPFSDDQKRSINGSDNDDDDGEDEFMWWKETVNDGGIKWKTLVHNGPFFPPPYEPHGVCFVYDGEKIKLEPNAEEVASFYAAVYGTDWAENAIFQENFFRDFRRVLVTENPKVYYYVIRGRFSKCNFSLIYDYLQKKKEERKSMTKEEKQKLKEEKLALDEHYGWAVLDGRKEKVGNYRIEPPGLFKGRGSHPKTGSLKRRVMPEQVTINIGSDATKVVNDNTVTWLAMWKENVNDSIKYVFLGATSSLKGQSDLRKFEKARTLKQYVGKIRDDYTRELKDKVMATRQRATAMYLIDRFALRAGNEKGEDEADTVGCCSLRFEHISLELPNVVIFDFLGKDSIRYYKQGRGRQQVFKNLQIFRKEPKKEGDLLFDRLSTTILNKHLSTYMDGLTAKVFRTFNASYTFQQELRKTPGGSVREKVLAYNRANRQVAILCNHQRTVSKGHSNQMEKIQEKLKGLKYERLKLKRELLKIDPKLGKSRPELKEDESDIDEAFVEKYEELLLLKENDKDLKLLTKENEKRAQNGEDQLKALPTKKKPTLSPERMLRKIDDFDSRIKSTKLLMIDKDENKTTALGTSKINYIDPRISVAWCKKHDVKLTEIFNKSLREKFKWAFEVDEEWCF